MEIKGRLGNQREGWIDVLLKVVSVEAIMQQGLSKVTSMALMYALVHNMVVYLRISS